MLSWLLIRGGNGLLGRSGVIVDAKGVVLRPVRLLLDLVERDHVFFLVTYGIWKCLWLVLVDLWKCLSDTHGLSCPCIADIVHPVISSQAYGDLLFEHRSRLPELA